MAMVLCGVTGMKSVLMSTCDWGEFVWLLIKDD